MHGATWHSFHRATTLPRAFDTAKDTYKRESLSVKKFSVSVSFLENDTATARVEWRAKKSVCGETDQRPTRDFSETIFF